MEEASVTLPKSYATARPRGGAGDVSGPDAPGDEVGQAIHSSISMINFMLQHKGEEIRKISGGWYFDRLMDMMEELKSADEILRSRTDWDN